MVRFKDLTGQKFGRLTVLKVAHSIPVVNRYGIKKGYRYYYLCQCECGKTKTIFSGDLVRGHTISCGCYQKEVTKKAHYKHGFSNSRINQIWKDMKKRCFNPNRKDYKFYGGRGITICNEWLDNFMNFYNWAMANGYQDNLTIDRINVNGNYEPDNCRWITIQEQAKNKRKKDLT